MAETKTITAAQRAANFALATRQNMQMLPTQTSTLEASTLQFSLPKARLLSSIIVNCELKLKATGTDATVKVGIADLHNFVRRWSLDLNNGFSPYIVGGRELYFMNLLNGNTGLKVLTTGAEEVDTVDIKKSTSGTENTLKFAVELSTTLNPRDSVGLVLLQNDQTNVTLSCDIGMLSDITTASGLTSELISFKATPMVESFSIPASADAFPDLSVIKLTNSRNDSFVGNGQHIVRLSTGTIYRRILFRIVSEDGTPLSDEQITSDIQLVFNQADINYSISPQALRTLNMKQLGYALPTGVYAFDFSYQGIPNLGGTRDFIDTERLTEFWLRFSTTGSGRCEIISECLARLQ